MVLDTLIADNRRQFVQLIMQVAGSHVKSIPDLITMIKHIYPIYTEPLIDGIDISKDALYRKSKHAFSSLIDGSRAAIFSNALCNVNLSFIL